MKKALINYITKEKEDDCYTPEYAIKPLLKYLPKNITIWECCDFGKSEITRILKENNYKVISTGKEENFFKYQPNVDFDMIITNPPFSLKDDFIKKCYEWNKPFCLLLPITALEGINRGKMFREKGIEVLVFDRRINFKNITGVNKKSGCWFNSSWFCYNVLPNDLIFEELKKESKIKGGVKKK